MQRRIVAAIVFIAIFIAPYFIVEVNANENIIDSIKNQATKRNLQHDIHWIALLHYKKNIISDNFQSEAILPSFYLSQSGEFDPHAELLATIDAIFEPIELGDKHPQCVFPARSAWLIKQLNIDESIVPHPNCNLLSQWRSNFAPKQASVVFPSSYMNNPSSMFGHAFLKFESPENNSANGLLAFTINFAADISSQRGVLDHLYRGLSGGFPVDNPLIRYYRMLKQYSDIETRDIWEFKLNLSSEEMERLVLHVWELKDKQIFKYYFFNKNCAYRLIRLIEVARPQLDISNQFTFFVFPIDVIRALNESGAIEKTSYKASAHKALNYHSQILDAEEKHLVIDIVTKNISLDSDQIEDLPPERRSIVFAIASEYLGLLINKDTINRRLSADLERKLLLERLNNAPMTFEEVPYPLVSPYHGHKGHRMALGVGQDNDGGFLSLGYRQAYHDLMDPIAGFDKGMKVEFLNAEIRRYDTGEIRLGKIDLINLSSLTPIDDYSKALSWKASLGREYRGFDFIRPVNFLEGGWGVTLKFGEIMILGMVDLSLENSHAFTNGVGFGAGANIELLYQSDNISYRLGLGSRRYLGNVIVGVEKYFGEVSVSITRNMALVVEVKRSCNRWDEFFESTINARSYF
jgi:hypothetical protein